MLYLRPMLKLLLLLLLCGLGYYLMRNLRASRRPRDGRHDPEARHIDPSRAVDAQFEDIDQDKTAT
jgi:hypothetical protein